MAKKKADELENNVEEESCADPYEGFLGTADRFKSVEEYEAHEAQLDKYLRPENYESYQRLIEGRNLFDPSKFFQLLEKQVRFIETNKTRPLFVSRTIRQLPLKVNQHLFLYDQLIGYFRRRLDTKQDASLEICLREIGLSKDNLVYYESFMNDPEELEPAEFYESDHDLDDSYFLDLPSDLLHFQEVVNHAEKLPDTKSKIAYLIAKRTEWEHAHPNKAARTSEHTFGDKCDLEIAMYKQLLDLEKDQNKTAGTVTEGINENRPAKHGLAIGNKGKDAPAEGDELVGKPSLTVDQFIILMFAIGGPRFKGLDKKKIAQGLSSLTGNSVSRFIKRFSWVLPTDHNGIKKFNNHTEAYNKDVETVCEILTKMGLTDEVNKLKENSNI